MKNIVIFMMVFLMSASVASASSLSSGGSSGATSSRSQSGNSNEDLSDDAQAGTQAGSEMGRIDATAQGKMDFYEGKTNDYKRSLRTKDQLIKKYRLDKEVEKYRTAFLGAYNLVYEAAYKGAYRQGFSSNLSERTSDSQEVTYTTVTMEGATINSADSVVNMKFEQGSVYLPNNIRIQKENDKLSEEALKNRFIQGSNIYKVEVKNEDGYIDVYKPITMTFKYIGPENVGVYKKINNTWLYYDSTVVGNTIRCRIDEKKYSGGEYVVLIDKRDKGLVDIQNHWAKDELKIVSKRGWISGYEDGTFRGYGEITRAEFAVIMYNVLGWYNYNIADDAPLHFTDVHLLGPWGRKAVYAGVVTGVISGYPDGSFRPNDKISYQEVEWLVRKMYKDRGYGNFVWEDIAQVMMDEKGAISKGLTSKYTKIPRDEVAYMFYILNRGF